MIEVSYEVLKDALYLPPNAHLLRVRHSESHYPTTVFEVLVEHPDLPATAPGETPPQVRPGYTIGVDGKMTFDWGVGWSR